MTELDVSSFSAPTQMKMDGIMDTVKKIIPGKKNTLPPPPPKTSFFCMLCKLCATTAVKAGASQVSNQ